MSGGVRANPQVSAGSTPFQGDVAAFGPSRERMDGPVASSASSSPGSGCPPSPGPVVGRVLAASAETSTHACGGTLLFIRDADGHSYERCSECEWRYDFDNGRVSDAVGMGVRWGQ